MTRAEFMKEMGAFVGFLRAEMRPRGKLLTPFNVISLPIMLAGTTLPYATRNSLFGLGVLGAVIALRERRA